MTRPPAPSVIAKIRCQQHALAKMPLASDNASARRLEGSIAMGRVCGHRPHRREIPARHSSIVQRCFNAIAQLWGPGWRSIRLRRFKARTTVGDHTFSTNRSTTFFSPALSNAMVSLLPSTAITFPLPNFI
jgi:hypothetical protein